MAIKRQTKEEKRDQLIIELIDSMFQIAGHPVTYKDIKDRKDNWFQQWSITESQYDQWKTQGETQIKKSLQISSKAAKKEMTWVGLMWGLSIKK